MDAFIMLLYCYQSTNVTYSLQPSHTFAKFVDYVCSKFIRLLPRNILLFYKILGYNNFSLQNDVDMQNMICLAHSFRLQLVDVVIEQHLWGDNNTPSSDPMTSHAQVTTGVTVLNELGMDDEVDLLQSFCPHKEKVFIFAPWANGSTHIGQHFEGAASEFCNVLRKYAVECGFQIKYVKNDSVRVTAIYAMNKSKSCTWAVHEQKLEANGFFYLRKWNSEHICGVAVRTSTHPLIGSKLVADIIAERVRDRPLTHPTKVILDLKQNYGLDITYRVMWLGVEKVRGELFGAHSILFDQLCWYSNAVLEHNPGTYINIEYDDHTHRFTRYFISFKTCIDGFSHCCPLFFLDTMFLKGRFKGFLLVATAKDGNQGLFPLSYVVVDSENTTNWSWFLQHLAQVVHRDRPLTFVSDRNLGLLEAMPTVFPNAKHAFCLQHLQRNLRDRLRYTNSMHRAGLVSKLRYCTYEPTVTVFNHKVEQFHKSGRSVASKFLANAHPQHWANAFFKGWRYGEMCSNAAESFNSWVQEACNLPITRMVDSIRTKLMRQMAKRRDAFQTWTGTICPKMESRLEKEFNEGRSWKVSQSNADVYEVHYFPSVTVDIGQRTCSCFKWQLNGFPYAYAMVTVRKSGWDLNTLVEPYFHVSEYRSTYVANICPIPTVEQPPFNPNDYIIKPPAVKRPPGRPKKKRILSKGEHVQQIRCGRCGRIGNHNKKTCNKPI